MEIKFIRCRDNGKDVGHTNGSGKMYREIPPVCVTYDGDNTGDDSADITRHGGDNYGRS
jgi:hypothetical protein